MNQKKAKAIRRAMRGAIENGSSCRWVAHPDIKFINGEPVVRYSFQYRNAGGKALVKAGKKIYRLSGVLPRSPNG